MPIQAPSGSSSKSSKKKKKKGFFDRIPGSKIAADVVDDFEDIAKQTPGGVFEMAKALDPRANLNPGRLSPRSRSTGGTPAAAGLVKAMALSTAEDFRHPLRHPGYTLLDILGLAPLFPKGAGALAKTGAIGKTAKAAAKARPKNPTRTLTYKPKAGKDAEVARKAMKLQSAPKTVKFKTPAARSPLTRQAQKGLDKARGKSYTLQRRKVEKLMAQKQEILARQLAENPPGIKGAAKATFGTTGPLKKLGPDPNRGGKEALMGMGAELLREGNAGIRAARLYRGAYVPPNWLGAQAVNMIHSNPVRYAKGVRKQRQGRKQNRDQAQMVDRMGGETLSQASMETQGSGPIGTLARGIGTSLSKVTDRAPRNRVWREEARRHGYESEQDIARLFHEAEQGSWKAKQDLYEISDRAEKASIKFSRSGTLEGRKEGLLSGADRVLADNLFLYKWLTGSGRYGGHVLGEHPTLAMVLAQSGREAPSLGDMLPEGYPSFMENYIPRGTPEDPRANNPTAASLFDMPFDVLNAIQKSGQDWRNIADILQPMQAGALNAATGYDPFTGEERARFDQDPAGALGFGYGTQVRSIPHLEWLRMNDSEEERERKLFPLTPLDILLRQTVGSSLTPKGVPINPRVAKSMKKNEDKKDRPPGKKRRRRRESF